MDPFLRFSDHGPRRLSCPREVDPTAPVVLMSCIHVVNIERKGAGVSLHQFPHILNDL